MKDVARFLSSGKFAIAGVSRNPKKFGNVMFKDLLNKGMDVVPVNPNTDSINGIRCYPSVNSLPEDVRAVIFMTPKEQTGEVARETIAHGIKDLWLQQGSETKEIIGQLQGEEINLIHNECIMMFWKPSGIHSFHRFLKRIFGHLPA